MMENNPNMRPTGKRQKKVTFEYHRGRKNNNDTPTKCDTIISLPSKIFKTKIQ